MKKLIFVTLMLITTLADARGGMSSGGRGGFSSGGRSFSSSPSRSFSSTPSRSYSTPTRSTTTTTTTTSRSYSYGGRYVSPGPMYGGWGMGYGYSNGLITGMIIGNMMHPHNTVMYTGPGVYNNNALLYPNGQVVNQQGYLVGNYSNGNFVPVENGAMVAQAVPQDAGQIQQPVQPVIIKTGPTAAEIVAYVFLSILICFLLFILFGVIL